MTQEPTPAQIKAGNYPKGHLNMHGMRLSVENPQGSIRRGTSRDGTPWASQLTHDYGYIRGAWGRDKDHLDVYLGPDADTADRVFVIDQLQPHTAKFDEHKVMLGFPDADAAREAYLDQFPEGWAGAGGVTEMPLATFKKWAFQKGRRVKPLSTEVAELTAQAYAGGGLVKAIKAASKGRSVAEGASDVPKRLTPLSAVKEPGGNWWLPDEGYSLVDNYTFREGNSEAAKKWRLKQLDRYLRNDLGTARDPLLELERQNRLHVAPEELNAARSDSHDFDRKLIHRELTGRKTKTPWEAVSDGTIERTSTGDIIDQKGREQGMPEDSEDLPEGLPRWFATAKNGTLYTPDPLGNAEALGFDHLMDYLDAALTGDPLLATRGLALTPEQLAKSSVPDIVAKTSEWNKLLEAQKLGDLNKGIKQVHWTDPDTGYQIVELDPEGLAAEGAAMKHCVGGYCSKVADGTSRILSVRDRDGVPHATVEVGPPKVSLDQIERLRAGLMREGAEEGYIAAQIDKVYPALDRNPNILQIQGPRNSDVAAKAQPALRALIRGQVPGLDKFGRVNHFERSGLVHFGKADRAGSSVASSIRWPGGESQVKIPGGFYTRAELANEAIKQGVPEDVARKHFGDIEGLMRDNYASGGSVPDHDKDVTTAEPIVADAGTYAFDERPKGRTAAERLLALRGADDANAELARPYIGVRNANRRPEHRNNRAASAEMPLVAARSALATLLGAAGDIETLGRMAINVPRDIEHALRVKTGVIGDPVFKGVADEPALLGTEHFREALPTFGLDTNGAHGRMAEGLVDTGVGAAGIGALTQLAGALRRGAAKAGTKAADAMDSWRDSYIPRKADVDLIFDRAGKVLNPRAALPAYAEGGGVQAINDYSDDQYAAAQQWAQGRSGAEITAAATKYGLDANQLARVLGSPNITGADVTAAGYGTTGGLNADYMDATYNAPGVYTNPATAPAPGTWKGGSGANLQELINANTWATGKTGAQIRAQMDALGITDLQGTQVFGADNFGGVGKSNMVWDGTKFVQQPDDTYYPGPPSVWNPPTPPGPAAPPAPQPEFHAPTAYLRQTEAGNQAWRMGAPGAQTGWTAPPTYADGGGVGDGTNYEQPEEVLAQWRALNEAFKLPNANNNLNLSAEDLEKLQAHYAQPGYNADGMNGPDKSQFFTDSSGYTWRPDYAPNGNDEFGQSINGPLQGYLRGNRPGDSNSLSQGNLLDGFRADGTHYGTWKNEKTNWAAELAPILSVAMPALGGIFAPALSSVTAPITTALTEAGLPAWLSNAVPGAVGKGALSELAGGNFLDGAAGSVLNAGLGSSINELNLDPSTANTLKLLAGPALRGQNPLTPTNLLKLATQP